LKKLGYDWAANMYHLSYGMVDLPSGKMKSREGTVVDADELMEEMTATAREISQELGKLDGYSDKEKETLYKVIGMGALKYYILKVDPKKRILFAILKNLSILMVIQVLLFSIHTRVFNPFLEKPILITVHQLVVLS